ncbi:hypothetical protein BBJ28_00022659 [Nothophytophthora sp. Chile5]|nr:hypothetical protein BBJ28_00022659 [Nothophytophthora sp. Chile5]
MVRLPNAKYHTELTGVTSENVETEVHTVFLFATLQILSFLLLSTWIRRNLGMKSLYQLAFVLETQMELIQIKLMAWVLMTMAFRVVHFAMASEEDEEFVYSAGELEDEDEEDVAWEDVEEEQLEAADPPPVVAQPLQQSPEAPSAAANADACVATSPALSDDASQRDDDAEAPDLQSVDWGQVNRALAEQDAASSGSKKRRRAPVRLSRPEKQRELALHQSHLLVLLATQIKWSALRSSTVLRGLLLSLTANGNGVDFFADMRTQPLAYSLELLVRWFRQEFQLATSTDEEGEEEEAASGELASEARLVNAFFARKGRDFELALLFAALCGALQLRCRLTSALDPLLVQRGKAFESSMSQRPKTRRRSRPIARSLLKKKLRSEASEDDEMEKDEGNAYNEGDEGVSGGQSFWLWCEVLDERAQSWIHVDAVRRLVGCPQQVEPLRGKAARFSYVVSTQDDGVVVDVTPRYASQWSKSLELRLADSWLKQVIQQFNQDAARQRTLSRLATGSALFAAEDADRLLADEKRKLQAMTLTEGMPSSVEGFRKHPTYCLERHLGRFECLHPRKAVGLFNGQPVFLRSHVFPAQSAFKWRRLGREVKAGEREKPAKWHSRGGKTETAANSDGSDDDGRPGGASMALFGLWQTAEIEPPAMADGRVPKNKYGNIEVWSPAHIPRGAVHLRLPRIEAVAQALGVDFAPAVVGFELRSGRTVPRTDGVVVAQAAELLLLEAHAHRQQAAIERAIGLNRRLARRRWARLATRLLLRRRLEEDYGAV